MTEVVNEVIRLTEWTNCGGCAAKWGASLLADLIGELAEQSLPDGFLAALSPSDDAAVVDLGNGQALVSTTDFFPPLVDDPEDFGAIAAANACSDVFAMGGRVLVALNIAAFPERLPRSAIAAILRGSARTVAEAGGATAGGHTIRSEEPIFGLAVQGLVDPERVWRKSGALPGDRLMLSKPLGTGLVLAAGSELERAEVIAGMKRLNREAAVTLSGLSSPPHAVTDVTGFGLAGHAWEMAHRSGVSLRLSSADLPLYPGARRVAEEGVRTGGDVRNREYVGDAFRTEGFQSLDWPSAVVFDPQTSGGLLAAVDPSAVKACSAGGFVEVGQVEEGPPGLVLA